MSTLMAYNKLYNKLRRSLESPEDTYRKFVGVNPPRTVGRASLAKLQTISARQRPANYYTRAGLAATLDSLCPARCIHSSDRRVAGRSDLTSPGSGWPLFPSVSARWSSGTTSRRHLRQQVHATHYHRAPPALAKWPLVGTLNH
jgi:hypothetical protein